MKAIAAYAYGGLDELKLVDLPTPLPEPGEVLVRARAAGVNLVDTLIRAGYRPKNEFPLIPGWDLAGVVEQVGQDVTDMAVGAEVYGYKISAIKGTYAEYTTVPAEWVSRKPSNLSYEEAAGLACAGLTAYQTLVEQLEIQTGETVLITAAAGGVGSLAVQIAKAKGAHVIGTASGRNQDYVRDLGADVVIDYTKGDWVETTRTLYPDGVDAVFTCIAGETKQRSPGVLRDGGRMAWISGEEQVGPPMERRIQGVYSYGFPKRETFAALTQMAEAGQLKVPIDEVFPLDQAARAHERIAAGDFQGKVRAGHVRGKLVIAIACEPLRKGTSVRNPVISEGKNIFPTPDLRL